MYGRELPDVIKEEIKLCGYFVIITSEDMTAAEALNLYKSRDVSEKLFRRDKSYMGNKSFRAHTSESVHAKIFIEFVALIICSRFYTCLKEQMNRAGKKNYMTVPAAIRELEKIELIRQSDRRYRMDHAVTATQKEILKAFGMTASSVRIQATALNDDLMAIEKDRYERELEKLNTLMKKRNELQSRELMEAFASSDKSFEEVMRFLTGKDDADDE